MLNSNLAYNSKEYSWNLPEWSYLVDEVSKVFRLTHSEKERLNNSITVRFQKYCSHTPDDDSDIFNRLAFNSTFEGGNQ